jgi:hypothetical protein
LSGGSRSSPPSPSPCRRRCTKVGSAPAPSSCTRTCPSDLSV